MGKAMGSHGTALSALLRMVVATMLWLSCTAAIGQGGAAAVQGDYVLGAGDVIKVTVFQQPELSLDVRIAESGMVSYPLIGAVRLGGLTGGQAERLLATRLRSGNFLQNPQISVNVSQYRSQQVSVLGAVNKPGRYPLELSGTRLSEVLAQAGGIVTGIGADSVNLVTRRDGQTVTLQVDIVDLFGARASARDEVLQPGDSIYVHRAPAYYIYGQVQRPGMYSIERGMTVAQAIAKAGGLTARGTERSVRLQRRNSAGQMDAPVEPKLEDTVRSDDLVFVRESLF
jgi:polysaccharide export outer membrane protein